ncbi:MAG: glycoside hydrolase family 3 N-terminal domain-containing protein [Pseudomonadota bacterium]
MAPSGAYILGCAGPHLSREEAAFFAEARPWGFILFARNIETPRQTAALTADLRSAVGWEAPILIDQEGGRVQRMGPPHWRQWRPPLDQVAHVDDDAAERSLYLRSRLIADELHRVGIDVNCTPLGDIASSRTHPFLRNRCYGDTPEKVTRRARAVATGNLAGGILPVVKHMPGHGSSASDSHFTPPRLNATPERLHAWDFAPFAALADLPLGMTSHVIYTPYDDKPATVSPRMIRLLREELSFGGLLMTDDISMEALGGTVAERGAAALAAGCDLVTHCNGKLDEMRALADVAGVMSAESAGRAHAALALRKPPTPIDIPAAEAELEVLLNGEVYGAG